MTVWLRIFELSKKLLKMILILIPNSSFFDFYIFSKFMKWRNAYKKRQSYIRKIENFWLVSFFPTLPSTPLLYPTHSPLPTLRTLFYPTLPYAQPTFSTFSTFPTLQHPTLPYHPLKVFHEPSFINNSLFFTWPATFEIKHPKIIKNVYWWPKLNQYFRSV